MIKKSVGKLKSGKKAPVPRREGRLTKEQYDAFSPGGRRFMAGSTKGLLDAGRKKTKLKSGKRKK